MRAAVFHEPRRVEAGDRPDAGLREPTDAVVRVALACVCGTPQLLPDVLDGRINPGRVLDYSADLAGIADAYAAMDERRAIKSLVRVGSL
jgi:threonine dehydrogenase-like Zn-dependent dehydrogenase